MARSRQAYEDDPLTDLPVRRSRRQRLWGLLRRLFAESSRSRRIVLSAVLFLPPALLLYYLVGGAVMHTVDDDTAFAAPDPPQGGSRTLAMAASLIEREVETHGWTANDPFFMPSAALDNMPNFQQGMIHAIARVTAALADGLGENGPAAGALTRTADLLPYPGDRWVIDFETSWTPVPSAESQYREAAAALAEANRALAAGEAGLPGRTAPLLAVLEGVGADLAETSGLLSAHLAAQGGWFLDGTADDLFYAAKGRLYAYAMLLEALRQDAPGPVETAGLRDDWQEMVESLKTAATLDPWIVVSGAPDGLLPSHLVTQGFYLMRAQSRLRAIAGALAG